MQLVNPRQIVIADQNPDGFAKFRVPPSGSCLTAEASKLEAELFLPGTKIQYIQGYIQKDLSLEHIVPNMDVLIGCSSKVDFKNKINDKVANFFFNYYVDAY